MTEEERKKKRTEANREWYAKHKDDPEFRERTRKYQRQYMAKLRAEGSDEFKEKRMKDKSRYYKRGTKNADNKGVRYTNAEIEMIMRHEIPDREIAKKLGRSIQAIQVTRSKMKSSQTDKGE